MGGGILLLAVMPGLLPPVAVLPLYALTQLTSNISRVAFGWREMDARLLPPIVLGGIAGAWLGSTLYAVLNLDWLPLLIGVFILLITWCPLSKPRGRGSLVLILPGFYQTGIGMLAGATGPLGAAVLAQYSQQRDWLVVNTAAYMSINHILRAAAYGLLGFSLGPWWPLLLAMIAATVAGSWLGTHLRKYLPQTDFSRCFRLLITLLALRMIVMS